MVNSLLDVDDDAGGGDRPNLGGGGNRPNRPGIGGDGNRTSQTGGGCRDVLGHAAARQRDDLVILSESRNPTDRESDAQPKPIPHVM